MQVTNLNEAREWFTRNAEGGVQCVREDGAVITAATYVDAMHFYLPPGSGAAATLPSAAIEEPTTSALATEADESAAVAETSEATAPELQPAG